MKIGATSKLEIVRFTSPGAFLKDKEGSEILLPTKFIPAKSKVGDTISVFVYKDSEDRPIATTLAPHLEVDGFAFLKVKQVTKFGAFLDWGIEKDLLVPFREQVGRMEEGQSYIIHLYLDPKTERLVGTQKINGFFEKSEILLEEGEQVKILIGQTTDIGINVIINDRYQGLLFQNEVFDDLMIGDRRVGFIKKIRPDKKIDVSLQKIGIENLEEGFLKILKALDDNDGFLSLTDKSAPEEIQFELQMSKKNFKRSLGMLYKKRLVELTNEGIKKS